MQNIGQTGLVSTNTEAIAANGLAQTSFTQVQMGTANKPVQRSLAQPNPEKVEVAQTRNVTLRQLTPGQSGKVQKISAQGAIRRRLFDMGVTPGVEILFKKAAPLGDPIEVKLRGYALSLRLSEAETVLLEVRA